MARNIYRRGKTWWARFTVDGEERRESLHTVHVTTARERVAKLIEDAKADQYWGGAAMTWQAAMMRYQAEVMPAAVKPNTRKRYEVSLRQVSPYLKDRPMHAITARTLSDMIAERRKKKAKPTNATIRRDLTAISRVFAAAKTWDACDHNPARDYDRQMLRERRDPITLPTNREVVKAFKAAPTPLFRNIMRFAAFTGMRQAEVLNLNWRQVDIARGAVRLDRTKTDAARVVPLRTPAMTILTKMDGRRGYVFGVGGNLPYRNFPSQFAAWRRRNAVPFRFHDLRHRYAVMYLRGGGNIYSLQLILGHASIKTTEIYLAHLTPGERSRAQNPAHP